MDTTKTSTIGTSGPPVGSPEDRSFQERAKREAEEAKAKASAKADAAASSLKSAAHSASEQLKQKSGQAADRLREQGRDMTSRQKENVGTKIADCGAAVRRAADKLREENDPNIAHYADVVADGLDRAGSYVRSRHLSGILSDVEGMARRRPELVFGTLFVAGLAAARFLKASGREAEEEEVMADYPSTLSQDERASTPIEPRPPAPVASPAPAMPEAKPVMTPQVQPQLGADL